MNNNTEENIETFCGKDNRNIYIKPNENTPRVLTGAIKCTAYLSDCSAPLRNNEGEIIGHCSHKFTNDLTVCPLCHTKRKQCSQPALKLTHGWEKPVCRLHYKQTLEFYNMFTKEILSDEKKRQRFDELLGSDTKITNEMMVAIAAMQIQEGLLEKKKTSDMLKDIKEYSNIFKSFKELDLKEVDNETALEDAYNKLIEKTPQIQLEAASILLEFIYVALINGGLEHVVVYLHDIVRRELEQIAKEHEDTFPDSLNLVFNNNIAQLTNGDGDEIEEAEIEIVESG